MSNPVLAFVADGDIHYWKLGSIRRLLSRPWLDWLCDNAVKNRVASSTHAYEVFEKPQLSFSVVVCPVVCAQVMLAVADLASPAGTFFDLTGYFFPVIG